MSTLFLAWQDPASRGWFPIGRLQSFGESYWFVYTNGAEHARQKAGFQGLIAFPDMRAVYVSDRLFPLFANRLLQPSRGEYREYLTWLSVPDSENSPVAILARSGGRRATDTLEVFPCPEPNENGEYEFHFLVHGVSHIPEPSAHRALQLKPGEPLLAMRDCQNPKDPEAVALRTAETFDGDMFLIGYCPRYLQADFLKLVKRDDSLKITVERVNPPPAPIQLRVLCKALTRWPEGFNPFDSEEYEPLVPVNAAESANFPLPHSL